MPVDTATAVSPAVTDSTPALPGAADRQAILAMAGGYRVEFAFDETVVLADGYQRSEPKRSGGTERLVLVPESPAEHRDGNGRAAVGEQNQGVGTSGRVRPPIGVSGRTGRRLGTAGPDR